MIDRKGHNSEALVNGIIANLLRGMRPRWVENVIYEGNTALIAGNPNQKVDILINHPTGTPVAIETEFAPARSVELDARSRLGRVFALNGNVIEQSIALRLPSELKVVEGGSLKNAILNAKFDYCLLSCSDTEMLIEPTRWPSNSWISGGVSDLAIFIEYTSLSENRIAESMTVLEEGIKTSTELLRSTVTKEDTTLQQIAACLRQNENEQTTRMAMAIVANAISFHMLIAGFNEIKTFGQLKLEGGHIKDKIIAEWVKIRDNIDYWPIFDIALQVIAPIKEHAFV